MGRGKLREGRRNLVGQKRGGGGYAMGREWLNGWWRNGRMVLSKMLRVLGTNNGGGWWLELKEGGCYGLEVCGRWGERRDKGEWKAVMPWWCWRSVVVRRWL